MSDLSVSVDLASVLRGAVTRTLAAIQRSNGVQLATRQEGEFHYGDDPIQADTEAQLAFEQAVYSHPAAERLQFHAIVGEENLTEVTDCPTGRRVVVVDPLDGSKLWMIGRQGFCVAAIVLRREIAGWVIDAAVLATTTECYTLYGSDDLRYGQLDGDPRFDVALAAIAPESPLVPPVLAAVAWKPVDVGHQKNSVWPVLCNVMEQLPGWGMLTMGGNPMCVRVLSGALTAAITLERSTTWDTVGVLMAAATDAVIGDIHGNRLSGPDFRALFAQVLTRGHVQAIPEVVVAKTDARYLEIVDALRRSTFAPL